MLCAPLLALASCAAPRGPEPYLPDSEAPVAWNGRDLPAPPADRPVRVLLLGHLYGDPQGRDTMAATVRAALPRLVELDADLWYCLGDTLRGFHPALIDPVLEVFARVPAPVFNAPGNHDVTDRAGYLARFGPTFGAFRHGPVLCVQIDTEARPWEIEGEQLGFLARVIEKAAADPQVRLVLVLGHKLVFAHRRRYLEVLAGANARDGLEDPNRFVADVLPLFAGLRADQRALWCAGDVGAPHTLPLFYDEDREHRIAYLATGVGDTPRDAGVLLEAGTDGWVSLAIVPLAGQATRPVEEYGPEHWRRVLFPQGVPAGIEALRARLPDG